MQGSGATEESWAPRCAGPSRRPGRRVIKRASAKDAASARAEMEAEMRAALARERERMVDAVREFAAAREQYFAAVEQQVVKLALAIAARVLHREAQIDPLLLAGRRAGGAGKDGGP